MIKGIVFLYGYLCTCFPKKEYYQIKLVLLVHHVKCHNCYGSAVYAGVTDLNTVSTSTANDFWFGTIQIPEKHR